MTKVWLKLKGPFHAIIPRHLNESYRPLVAQWLEPLGEMFDKGYRKLAKGDDDCTVPVDLQRPAFDYDTLGGNVTFEKIWDIIKN